MDLRRIALVAAFGGAAGITSARPADFETRERIRIQAHFDSVLAELRARDVTSLTTMQRSRRVHLVEALAAYRDAGRFPHNYNRPGLVPTFVDSRTGVRCAVAHLVASSGRDDIVERVAAADNHVYVVELSADTAFRHWLNANGLTLAEAARIQVPYAASPQETFVPAALALGSGGLAITNLVVSRGGKHRVLSGFGILAGGATVMAATSANQAARNEDAAFVAATAGGVSAIVGIATMFSTGHHDSHAKASATTDPSLAPVTWQLTSGQRNALYGFTSAAATFGALNAASTDGHDALGAIGIASGLSSMLVGLGARSTTSKEAGRAAIFVGALSTFVSAVSFSQPHRASEVFSTKGSGDTRRIRRIVIGSVRF